MRVDALRIVETRERRERIFAVDYPDQETFEAVDWLNDAPLSDDYKRRVFGANAERIFGISPR